MTPLLDEPLEGPVYLRASENTLPDLVAELHGRGIRIDVLGKIDSHKGGMRATYEVLPDAPVTKFTLSAEGRQPVARSSSPRETSAEPRTWAAVR